MEDVESDKLDCGVRSDVSDFNASARAEPKETADRGVVEEGAEGVDGLNFELCSE